MSSDKPHADPKLNGKRYSGADERKSGGVTYTPVVLAAFVAEQMLNAAALPATGGIRILDPAVGHGALLHALLYKLSPTERRRAEVVGYDTEEIAVDSAKRLLENAFPEVEIKLSRTDFLTSLVGSAAEDDLFSSLGPRQKFDLVIANPPYVRTQVMGGLRSQQIAKAFGLSGRVDLYYPFMLGIASALADHGVAGIITSNRFMTTRSGQSVRRAVLEQFNIEHAWDLGDTKLFDAAVLPSVLLARKSVAEAELPINARFSSIYETNGIPDRNADSVLSALEMVDESVVEVPDGRRFRVRHGALINGGNPEGTWRIGTEANDRWLDTVADHTWATFRHIGKIRVGVKTTADKVFIRSDWDEQPGGRPELVRSLITRHCARRFRAKTPDKRKNQKEILYPHEVVQGRRCAVDLADYPKSESYLAGHRDRLEARTYVIEAGRKWYEIWVPQDPSSWGVPKLVFPDISDKPIFWIDTGGSVVNGDCYWLRCEREGDEDLLWLALAVANSMFIESFYDNKFNNKLYAGRRRFITQYVEQFPLPDPTLEETKKMVALAKQIFSNTPSSEADMMAADLDMKVWRAFGLEPKEVSGQGDL